MIFRRYTSFLFSAVAVLCLQKAPRLAPKSLFQNMELIIRPLLTRLSPFSFKLFAIPFDYDTNVGGNPRLWKPKKVKSSGF